MERWNWAQAKQGTTRAVGGEPCCNRHRHRCTTVGAPSGALQLVHVLPHTRARRKPHLQNGLAQRLTRGALRVHKHTVTIQDKVPEAACTAAIAAAAARLRAAVVCNTISWCCRGNALLSCSPSCCCRQVAHGRRLQLRSQAIYRCCRRRAAAAPQHAWLADACQGHWRARVHCIQLGQVQLHGGW